MIKPNDVVTDIDPESRFINLQGQVLEIQLCLFWPTEIKVRFEKDPLSSKPVCFIYKEEDLKREEDWPAEYYANKFFGENWHHTFVAKNPLDKTKPCMVKDCTHLQSRQAWINACGSVCNVYVCAEHEQYYGGKMMDSFPFR